MKGTARQGDAITEAGLTETLTYQEPAVQILALFAPRRPSPAGVSAPHRIVSFVSQAVRSLVAPASLVEAPVSDPADVYEADQLPSVAAVEAAAAELDRATIQARRADRGKRAARKVLDRLPAGRYGAWQVTRVQSSRQTADLESIRATYKRLGLGPVPMKTCSPTVKVERVEAAPVEVGGRYELIPSPTLLNPVDGTVTVDGVREHAGQTWVTVSGLVALDADECDENQKPGDIDRSTWLVKPERIGSPAPAVQLAAV